MDRQINVILVDDEPEAINYLNILIDENFPNVKVLACASTVNEAIRKTYQKHPDLILLDIVLDDGDGFDLVKELEEEGHLPYIVFVTAYDKYAIDAFKANALDYLLKPVGADDLKRSLDKFYKLHERENQSKQIHKLLQTYFPKLRFNTRNGYIMIAPDELIYCESDGNYSTLFLKDNKQKVVTINLNRLNGKLNKLGFKRISRYNIINEKYLSEVNRGRQECILSCNNQMIKLKYSPKFMNGMS